MVRITPRLSGDPRRIWSCPRPSWRCSYSRFGSAFLVPETSVCAITFFEVGGHSLLAVSIINEVNALLDVNLTIPTFFLNPSIQGIARTLEEEKNLNAVPTLVRLRPSHTEGTLYFVEASMGMCRSGRAP